MNGCYTLILAAAIGQPTQPVPGALPLSIDMAIQELGKPCPVRVHINEPPWPTFIYRRYDMYDDCPDALDLLVKTPTPVDAQLLTLADSCSDLPTRYRAAWVLTQRSNRGVVPILEKMAESSCVEERYLAWHAYTEAIWEKKLPAPSSSESALRCYVNDENEEVREQALRFLGSVRAKAAVPILMDVVRENPNDTDAIHALGVIGDVKAAPSVLQAARRVKAARQISANLHIHLHALGRLPTADAVQFIIDHLDEYGAVEALFDSGSLRALPELRKHLEKLRQKRPGPNDGIDIAHTRVAIIRLAEDDPRKGLVQMATEGCSHSLWALQDYDVTPFVPDLLAAYKAESHDGTWRMLVIRVLAKAKSEAVTAAMIEHALALEADRYYHCAFDLRLALNARLGTSFRRMSDLQKYLKERPQLEQARGTRPDL